MFTSELVLVQLMHSGSEDTQLGTTLIFLSPDQRIPGRHRNGGVRQRPLPSPFIPPPLTLPQRFTTSPAAAPSHRAAPPLMPTHSNKEPFGGAKG